MIKIRKGTFETNSSSTHSIVISDKDRGYSYDLPVDENGILTLTFDEFGWGPDVLNTPYEKLTYLLTQMANDILNEEEFHHFELGLTTLTESKEIESLLDMLKDSCENIKDFEWESCCGYYPFGYIDHQSCGTANEEEPEELIFNNKILILIDNDNSCHFEDYFPSFPNSKPKKDLEKLFDRR